MNEIDPGIIRTEPDSIASIVCKQQLGPRTMDYHHQWYMALVYRWPYFLALLDQD